MYLSKPRGPIKELQDSLTKTLIINGYFIHLNDIIAKGENSIICKAFKEDTNEIYVIIITKI